MKTLLSLLLLLVTPWTSSWTRTAEDSELDKGVLLAMDGEYEKALDVFLDLRRAKPGDPILNYYAGLSHFFLKQSPQAAVYLEICVQKEAPFPEAYYWLAQVYLTEQKIDAAKKIVATGLEEFPGNKDLEELKKLLGEE